MSFYKKTFLGALILMIAYTAISIRITSRELLEFDEVVTNFIQKFLSDDMTEVMILFTTIGSYKVEYPLLLLAICSYWIYRRNLFLPLMLVMNLLGVRQLNRFLKGVYERPRPRGNHLVDVSGFSFPSGHAMISIGFYGFIAYLLFCEFRTKGKLAYFIPVSISLCIFLIGLSRVYLGVHFPSDVIGGFLSGGLWLIFCIVVTVFFRKSC